MSECICITNRKLCNGDFLKQVRAIAEAAPDGLILREKDLTEEAYGMLAAEVARICSAYGVRCILHTYVQTALQMGIGAIHLPLSVLREMTEADKKGFSEIGASCHSVEDALEAVRLGAAYITAGHIFATDCKKGIPGRGIPFLQEICRSVPLPVYAIGGIGPENVSSVVTAGAAGYCVMGSMMRSSPGEQICRLREKANVDKEAGRWRQFWR